MSPVPPHPEQMQSFLDAHSSTSGLPIAAKTMACSFVASLFRICIMPIDTVKTVQQVQGRSGLNALMAKVMAHGPLCLYDGWMATQAASLVSHYPWFATRNFLRSTLDAQWWGIYKDVLIGVVAAIVSDLSSNSMRVLKTFKQTNETPMTYREVRGPAH
jgi:ABC-type dipeptide/oligopeptide/nickel transport system permease subunit